MTGPRVTDPKYWNQPGDTSGFNWKAWGVDLASAFDELNAENMRLLSGDFTPEEIHNFCHKLSAVVPRCEFEEGCRNYQDRLYGEVSDE